MLMEFLADHDARMLAVVGVAGVGKTALVRTFFETLARLGGAEVHAVVFLDSEGWHSATFKNMVADLTILAPDELRADLTRPGLEPQTLIRDILRALPTGQIIVVIDGFDSLANAGRPQEPALEMAIQSILAEPDHGVRLILTSRVPPSPNLRRRQLTVEGLAVVHAIQLRRARPSVPGLHRYRNSRTEPVALSS
jgi:hypothetical protein